MRIRRVEEEEKRKKCGLNQLKQNNMATANLQWNKYHFCLLDHFLINDNSDTQYFAHIYHRHIIPYINVQRTPNWHGSKTLWPWRTLKNINAEVACRMIVDIGRKKWEWKRDRTTNSPSKKSHTKKLTTIMVKHTECMNWKWKRYKSYIEAN